MAQKNAQTLNRTHLIALGVNAFYLLLSLLIFRKRSLLKYFLLNGPALIFEFWFERVARPTYQDGELKRAGEDLEAKGLTEWMWDIEYWTWGNVVLVANLGDWAWWGMVVPVLGKPEYDFALDQRELPRVELQWHLLGRSRPAEVLAEQASA